MKSIEDVKNELTKRIEACDVQFYEGSKKVEFQKVILICINETGRGKENPNLVEFQGTVECYTQTDSTTTSVIIQNNFADFVTDIEIDDYYNIPEDIRVELKPSI